MGEIGKPQYDFSLPIFQKNFLYKRLAQEHINLSQLESDSIEFEVKKTRGSQKVPEVYHVHYHLKSIIGIDEDQNPLYGSHHVVELTIPPKYPLEPAKIYMVTEIWHPNVKSEGKFKGRICGNTRDFGKGYELSQLVLRVGEIIQYKNYHAKHTPPYPEDAKVAEWVLSFAEPNDIINADKGIFVDNTKLVKSQIVDEPTPKPTPPPPKPKPKPKPTPPPPPPTPPASEQAGQSSGGPKKIKLGSKRKVPKSKIQIKPKD